MTGSIAVRGPEATITIRRDAYGVAHVAAANEHDAFFGQGFVAAQDRLWQMEYDRRRATGRWSEAVGQAGVGGDVLARRLQLERAARADVAAMSGATRAIFEAYAAGVNAFLKSGQPLPLEYALTRLTPEPWEPWHSVVAFKIRHVLMGIWQQKVAQATLLARIGPEAYTQLDGRPPIGSPVILPPGRRVRQLFETGLEEIRAAAAQLGFLAEVEAGSNSWAVHGSRTTTGLPVLCNDSHRALDVPNVYWQVHITCPQFDVIGATFPGIPGFPHFGHNGHVGWNITHTMADYQDLYIEQFRPAGGGQQTASANGPLEYRTPDGWTPAERQQETIHVAGGAPVQIEVWRTRHGSIVHGDPRSGMALSLRYTATDTPVRAWECLRPMLSAQTVAALYETQREWVDPVNNMVAADTSGTIGYLTRGYLPIRSSAAGRQFPVPGWTGEHEWIGRVPFERLPQSLNPPEGFIATANQRVIPEDEPYIAHYFSPHGRAQRIVQLLSGNDRMSPAEIAAIQGDTTSCFARTWVHLLARSGPFEGDAERARVPLATWDGNLLPESGAALLYSHFRRAVGRALFEPIVGPSVWQWLTRADSTATDQMISRWLAHLLGDLAQSLAQPAAPPSDDVTTPAAVARGLRPALAGTLPRTDQPAPASAALERVVGVLPEALARAWQRTVEAAGSDLEQWRWAAHHQTIAQHPLVARFPERAATLNPPRAAIGGDGDTIQAGTYLWAERPNFDITSLSVYRQVVDCADIAHSSYVIPGGVSGVPHSPHYADQLDLWRTHQRIPMHYTPADVQRAAIDTLTLTPT